MREPFNPIDSLPEPAHAPCGPYYRVPVPSRFDTFSWFEDEFDEHLSSISTLSFTRCQICIPGATFSAWKDENDVVVYPPPEAERCALPPLRGQLFRM